MATKWTPGMFIHKMTEEEEKHMNDAKKEAKEEERAVVAVADSIQVPLEEFTNT